MARVDRGGQAAVLVPGVQHASGRAEGKRLLPRAVHEYGVVRAGLIRPFEVVLCAVLPPEIARGRNQRRAARHQCKAALIGVLMADAAVSAGARQQRQFAFGMLRIGVQAHIARVREEARARARPGERVPFALAVRQEHVEQMQLEYLLILRLPRPRPRQRVAEALGIDVIRVLREEARPFRVVAAAPVAVAEGMNLPVWRAEMLKIADQALIERPFQIAHARKALHRREERQIPLRIAGRIEHALRPAAVRPAEIREDAAVHVERQIQPALERLLRHSVRALQHKRRLAQIGRQPPRVRIAGVLAEVDAA